MLKSKMQASPRSVTFRLDADLSEIVEQWLQKNPSLKLSRLMNLAVRRFLHEPQQLQSVTTDDMDT